mmetsp:Transcript_14493/g.36700  ORF Transcript_14493/g.36700 Transcript_14493/m.36700 type:complete len:206 (+) Transcript_14493:922-1539(+)
MSAAHQQQWLASLQVSSHDEFAQAQYDPTQSREPCDIHRLRLRSPNISKEPLQVAEDGLQILIISHTQFMQGRQRSCELVHESGKPRTNILDLLCDAWGKQLLNIEALRGECKVSGLRQPIRELLLDIRLVQLNCKVVEIHPNNVDVQLDVHAQHQALEDHLAHPFELVHALSDALSVPILERRCGIPLNGFQGVESFSPPGHEH